MIRALGDVVDDASDAERDDRVMRARVDKIRALATEAALAEAARWGQFSDLEFCHRCRAVQLFDYQTVTANAWHEFAEPLSDGRRGFFYRLQVFRCRECFVRGHVERALEEG